MRLGYSSIWQHGWRGGLAEIAANGFKLGLQLIHDPRLNDPFVIVLLSYVPLLGSEPISVIQFGIACGVGLVGEDSGSRGKRDKDRSSHEVQRRVSMSSVIPKERH